MTALQNEPCRATRSNASTSSASSQALPPHSAATTPSKPTLAENVEQLGRPHGRVGTRGVELPELRVHVRDRRHERRPGLRVLPPETDEARLQLDASDVGEVERGEPTEELGHRRIRRPERGELLHLIGCRACTHCRVAERRRHRVHRHAGVEDKGDRGRVESLAELEDRRHRRAVRRLPALDLGGERYSAGLGRGNEPLEDVGGDPRVEPDDREPERPRSLDLRAQEGDRLVRRHQPVDAPHEVRVPAERRRLQIVSVREAPECEHLVGREPRELTPGLITDELDARPESLAPDAPKHLRERDGTAPATRS